MDAAFALTPLSYAVVCFFVGLAGFVDASAGGGGLISLPAYLFTGMPAHLALGSNKFSSACGTTLTVVQFWRGRAIDVKAAAIAAAGSFLGSAAGARLALFISNRSLRTMLVFLLPCAAVIIFLKRNFGAENHADSLKQSTAALLAALIGFFIGGYDGLAGPGTGTFAIMAFALAMKYDLRTASGNAKILNLASNYAAFITFAISGNVLYRLALPAAVCVIIGNYIGSRCALNKGAKFIRPMMVAVLCLLLLKIVIDILHG